VIDWLKGKRMNFLIVHQLDIMLFMSGICGILAVLAMMTKSLSHRRRRIITQLEFAAMLLLISDRQAYIFRGDTSALGFWMVRISNFLVFFLTLAIIYCFNLYLIDLFTHEGRLEAAPRRLKAASVLALVGMAMVTRLSLLLPIIALAMVLSSLSDLIQFAYFRATHGKRFFKMAPLHHHFELSGMPETSIVAMYYITTAVLCLIALLGFVA
jgi:hypothetical protein